MPATAPARRDSPAPRWPPYWLSRNLRVLCGVSFLQDAATELLYPILPIFLTVTLGAPAAVVGVVEGCAEGAAAATKLVAGRLADRWPRRPLVGIGYGLAAAGKLLVAVAGAWPVVLAGRCVDRLGKGVRGAPRDALLVVGVPREALGRAFGLHRAADTAGAVLGPLVGLAGYVLLDHRIRPLLVLAVIPAVLSVLLVAAVREAPREAPQPSPATAPPAAAPSARGGVFRVDGLPRRYWHVLAALLLFSFINFPDALLLLRAHEVGFSVTGILVLYVAYNAVYTVASYPAGVLSDRWPRPAVFAAGLVCFAACYLGLAWAPRPAWVWAAFVVYGGFTAATDGVGKAWIASLVGGDRQGSAQGVFQATTGAGMLVAGLWAGLAWGNGGRLPLLVSGCGALLLAGGLLAASVRPRAQGRG